MKGVFEPGNVFRKTKGPWASDTSTRGFNTSTELYESAVSYLLPPGKASKSLPSISDPPSIKMKQNVRKVG